MPEKKRPPGAQQQSLWGGEISPSLPPLPTIRRGKKSQPGSALYDNRSMTQPSLWTAAVEPAPPDPQPAMQESRSTSLPQDPEILAAIPEDIQAFVTHIPRYLQPPEEQKASVVDLIPTRFFLLSYDDSRKVRHHIGGTLLDAAEGEKPQPLLHMGIPHALDRAIGYLREVLTKQGYLPKTEPSAPAIQEKTQTDPAAVIIPDDLIADVAYLPLHSLNWEERKALSLQPGQFYIATWTVEEGGKPYTVYVPGIVLRTDAATGDPEVYSFFNYIDPDIALSFQALREVISKYKEAWPQPGKAFNPTHRTMQTVGFYSESYAAFEAASNVDNILNRRTIRQMEEAQKPKPRKAPRLPEAAEIPQSAHAWPEQALWSESDLQDNTAQEQPNEQQKIPDDLRELVSLVSVDAVYAEKRAGIEIPTELYIFVAEEKGRTIFVPGRVIARDEETQQAEIMTYFHAQSREIEDVYGFLREAASNLGLLPRQQTPATELPSTLTEETQTAQQAFLTAYAEHTAAIPAERQEEQEPLPFNLRKLVKVTHLSNMSRAKRLVHVIKEPLCIIAVKGRTDEVIRYKAGVIIERDPETKRQSKVDWLMEESKDVNEAWKALEHAVRVRGWTEADLQPITDIPAPQPQPQPESEGPTPEELAEQPLLAILQLEEIYHDPYEVTLEEAEENNFPLLFRDVTTHIWWLEFPVDASREAQPELYTALTEHKWTGHNRRWFNRDPYAKVPDGLYYANAGPCDTSEHREGKYQRQYDAAVRESNRHYERSTSMSSLIPFGQPMLVDHYSYGRDRNYRNKIAKHMEKAVQFYREAKTLEQQATGSRRQHAYRQTNFAMAQRIKRLEADLRRDRREYENIKQLQVGEKQPYADTILTEEIKEKALNRYRRYMTIIAREIIPLKTAIAEQGGLPIETTGQKPETGALLLMGGQIVVASHVTKANKTNLTCISYSVPGFTKEGWKGTYPLTSFKRVLMTAQEVQEALRAGKTYAQLTTEWGGQLKAEAEEE